MNAIRIETRSEAGRAEVRASTILDHPRDIVFAAFADAYSRAQWCAPPGAGFRYLESAFAIGARDIFECAGPGGRTLRGEVRYEDIVPDLRIAYRETLFDGDERVSSASVTVAFDAPTAGSTQVTMGAALEAGSTPELVASYGAGLRIALEGLGKWLARPQHESSHPASSSGESP